MIVSVFNKKGGTGKTTLSMSLAKDLGDYYVLSNDDSAIELLNPARAKVLKNISDTLDALSGENIICDLGGYLAAGIENVLEKSDIVIIPMTVDGHSIAVSINTITEVLSFNKNVVVVLNKLLSKRTAKYHNELAGILDAISNMGIPTIQIRDNEAFFESTFTGVSFLEKYNESPLSRHSYRIVYEEYSKLINIIKEKTA